MLIQHIMSLESSAAALIQAAGDSRWITSGGLAIASVTNPTGFLSPIPINFPGDDQRTGVCLGIHVTCLLNAKL